MDCVREGKENLYTFEWKIENFRFCWQKTREDFFSPKFVVKTSEETTKWRLVLCPKGFSNAKFISVYLQRALDNSSEDSIFVKMEFSFLSACHSNSRPLYTRLFHGTVRKGKMVGCSEFMKREDLFVVKRSALLTQDFLTVRCNMRINEGQKNEGAHYFARTVIKIEPVIFTWFIKEFSKLEPDRKIPFVIKSFSGEVVAILNFLLTIQYDKEDMSVEITYADKSMKLFKIQSCILDARGKKIENTNQEFYFDDFSNRDRYFFLLTKRKLMENKEYYLPQDILSMEFECIAVRGIAFEGIERIDLRSKSLNENPGVVEHKPLESSLTLKDDLNSIYHDGFLSDMSLRTTTETFPVHKIILSARSPVFRSMFSSDLKEKIDRCVDISDIDSETLRQLLSYIYTDTVEHLNKENMSQLYEAADKYLILSLKNKCSIFIKDNLDISNACQILVVADLHNDEDLKSTVQDYILKNNYQVFNSKEWKQLMESNSKLALETMFRNYNNT